MITILVTKSRATQAATQRTIVNTLKSFDENFCDCANQKWFINLLLVAHWQQHGK
jgi:hypothetical protein